jgi:arylsulfatase A-like enzyme
MYMSRWNSLGYNGFDLGFATKEIDELALDGIIFDSYYAEHLCTPARAALLTGKRY